MAVAIPDLFGAYIKGRELAIQKNWEDLKNYEEVERMRNNNDIGALDILRQRMKMPGELSMYYDNVDSSVRANRIGEIAQPGMEAMTNAKAHHAVDMADIYHRLRPQVKQTMYDTALLNLGKQGLTNDYTGGQIAYLGQTDANGNTISANMGYSNSMRGYVNSVANDLLAGNQLNATQQQIELSNRNYDTNLLADDANRAYLQRSMNPVASKPPPEVVNQYLELAKTGNQEAIKWLVVNGILPAETLFGSQAQPQNQQAPTAPPAATQPLLPKAPTSPVPSAAPTKPEPVFYDPMYGGYYFGGSMMG